MLLGLDKVSGVGFQVSGRAHQKRWFQFDR